MTSLSVLLDCVLSGLSLSSSVVEAGFDEETASMCLQGSVFVDAFYQIVRENTKGKMPFP